MSLHSSIKKTQFKTMLDCQIDTKPLMMSSTLLETMDDDDGSGRFLRFTVEQ